MYLEQQMYNDYNIPYASLFLQSCMHNSPITTYDSSLVVFAATPIKNTWQWEECIYKYQYLIYIYWYSSIRPQSPMKLLVPWCKTSPPKKLTVLALNVLLDHTNSGWCAGD